MKKKFMILKEGKWVFCSEKVFTEGLQTEPVRRKIGSSPWEFFNTPDTKAKSTEINSVNYIKKDNKRIWNVLE